jgi:hypothetical protein
MKKSVSKKLGASRVKTSRLWRHYRINKKKIFSKKLLPLDFKRGLAAEQRDITRKNITITWEDYRGWKFGAIHHSRYKNFSFQKRHITLYSEQEFYKVSKYLSDKDLDSQIGKILNEQGVSGVGLIFRVKDEDTGLIHHVSEYVTIGLYEKLQGKGISLYDHLSTKLRYSKSVHEYKLTGRIVRIIYEKSKKMRS